MCAHTWPMQHKITESPPLILGQPVPPSASRKYREIRVGPGLLVSLAQLQLLAKLWPTRGWSLGPGMDNPRSCRLVQAVPKASAALNLYHLVLKPKQAYGEETSC